MATSLRLTAALLGATFVVLGACTTGASIDKNSSLNVIVDTDMGFDDVRALIFLLERDDVDVVAVSVVGTGIARCPEAGWNARAILTEYGQGDTPVGCGDRAPVDGFNTAPTAWRDEATALAGMALEPTDDELPAATDVLAEALAENPGSTVLALGPLTNLAPVLSESKTADNVGELRIMGGAVDVGGNVFSLTNFTAEFNIWIDPTAAHQVLQSGVPISLIPLDATNHVPITPATVGAFAGAEDTKASRLINGYYSATPLAGGLYHWDDLAAATLVDDTIVDMQTISLSVVTDAASDELGRTVQDDSDSDSNTNTNTDSDSGGVEVSVATSTDRDRFEETFYTTMTGVPLSTTGRWSPTATITFDGDDCSYDGPDPPPPTLDLEIANSSSTPGLGVLFVVYDPGTTIEQAEAFAERDPGGPPPFFDIVSIAQLSTNTTSVWVMRDLGPDISILCVINEADLRELAGQRLPT